MWSFVTLCSMCLISRYSRGSESKEEVKKSEVRLSLIVINTLNSNSN